MGWFDTNIIIRFRSGHNLSIDTILEDPNLSYILNKYEADLTRDKIQSIDKVIAVWLRRPIPEHETLETIKQILLESAEFKRLSVD